LYYRFKDSGGRTQAVFFWTNENGERRYIICYNREVEEKPNEIVEHEIDGNEHEPLIDFEELAKLRSALNLDIIDKDNYIEFMEFWKWLGILLGIDIGEMFGDLMYYISDMKEELGDDYELGTLLKQNPEFKGVEQFAPNYLFLPGIDLEARRLSFDCVNKLLQPLYLLEFFYCSLNDSRLRFCCFSNN
jgi:hypothetical protein